MIKQFFFELRLNSINKFVHYIKYQIIQEMNSNIFDVQRSEEFDNQRYNHFFNQEMKIPRQRKIIRDVSKMEVINKPIFQIIKPHLKYLAQGAKLSLTTYGSIVLQKLANTFSHSCIHMKYYLSKTLQIIESKKYLLFKIERIKQEQNKNNDNDSSQQQSFEEIGKVSDTESDKFAYNELKSVINGKFTDNGDNEFIQYLKNQRFENQMNWEQIIDPSSEYQTRTIMMPSESFDFEDLEYIIDSKTDKQVEQVNQNKKNIYPQIDQITIQILNNQQDISTNPHQTQHNLIIGVPNLDYNFETHKNIQTFQISSEEQSNLIFQKYQQKATKYIPRVVSIIPFQQNHAQSQSVQVYYN